MACPGLAFHEWATEQKLTRSSSLNELRGAQVAVDADDYVNRLLTDSVTREPLLPALGGLPMGIKKHVNSHLEIFREFDITPRFVFNGLDIAIKDRGTTSREARKVADSLNEAWTLYGQSRADAAVEEFGKSCTYRTSGVRRWLTQYLIRQGVNALLATYSAAAQVVYWKSQLGKNVDALAGPLDLLLFGAEKIITAFDWEEKTFSWTTADLIRTKLGLNQDQFIDVCLLSGLTILSPIDEVAESTQPALEAAKASLARANFDGVLAASMSKSEHYVDLFKKAKVAVKHMPVLQADGALDLLNNAEVFDNVHECISRRLPDEVLYYCARGIASPKLLNVRTQMELFEMPPLDGGNSQIYHDLVQQKLTPIRGQTYAILSHRLHRYYSRMDIQVVTWFNESNSNSLGVPEAISSLSKAADKWRVSESVLNSLKPFAKAAFDKAPLSTVLSTLSDSSNASKTIFSGTPPTLQSSSEFLSNALLRFLQGRGYIDESHNPTSWGKAYLAAINQAKTNQYMDSAESTAEAEEAIFLALELVRLDLLNGSPMFTSYSGAPLRGSDVDKANTNLISRVACLATFRHKELGFTGPLSRHLLAYHQIAAVVRNSLRDLLEVYAVDMLFSGAFSRNITPKQWSTYGAQLPLLKEPDLGLALVVKSYLNEQSHETSRRADITRWFPQALDLDADLKMAWRLWDAVNAGVQAAEAVPTSTKSMFSNADKWLMQKLAQASAPLPNGTG
ncbi:hypothetical protein AMS68_000346 [Peltaster fructicola]|uniref:XPG-I domain-containing protein n=1 Tax=Peltaster fructicola TaxID=286661 RepID=A0A6H0XJL6_9PEZI|nr:hypothetical protein AMS68_000346 [Peltaster fructicola]